MLPMSATDVAFFTEAAETPVLRSELPSAVTGVWTKRAAVRQTPARDAGLRKIHPPVFETFLRERTPILVQLPCTGILF